MTNGEGCGVQEVPALAGTDVANRQTSRAEERIADEWRAVGREMDPDLVRSAGDGLGRDQRAPSRGITHEHAQSRECGLATGVGAGELDQPV